MKVSNILNIRSNGAMRVFFQDGTHIYECFEDKSRIEITQSFKGIINKCRKNNVRLIMISKENVDLLINNMNPLIDRNWFLAIQYTIEMYYQFGLMSNIEYKKYNNFRKLIVKKEKL